MADGEFIRVGATSCESGQVRLGEHFVYESPFFLTFLLLVLLQLLFVLLPHCCFQHIVLVSTCYLYHMYLQFSSLDTSWILSQGWGVEGH